MITIKYIPNILNNKERLIKELPFSRKNTAKKYLLASGFDYIDKRIILSGKVIEDLDCYVDNNEELLILPKTEAGIGAAIWIAFVAIKAFVTAYAFWIKLTLFLASVGYAIYSARQKPRMPSFGNTEDQSPTYGWDGVTTTQDVGIPVPIVYGEHKVGGNIINAFVTTDGDKNYLNVLIALCEGEIDSISDIKINDNPIANYDGITTYQRLGTNDQSVIPNFEDLHNIYAVNTQLTKDNSYVYTTIDSDVEGFKLQLQIPGGLYEITNNGGLGEWSITYKVEYRVSGIGAYGPADTITITYKSRTVVRRYYEKTGLTAAKYDIRITRISADETDKLIGDLWLQSVDEVKTDDLAYPNTALLGIRALASEQLSGGMPNFTCIVKARKVSIPDIKDGTTPVDWANYYWDASSEEYKLFSNDAVLSWDESTYVEKWCANPIWCKKDLFINSRYGLGEYISASNLDSTLFLEKSRHCEERLPNGKGGYEKRFEFDVVLDTLQKALDWIISLCATYRGLAFYSEDAIKINIDKAELPVQLFTMGNIVKDSFVQSWKSTKEVPNVIDIQFMDEDKDYKQEQISYIDEEALAAGDPMRKKTLRLFTTKISQTIREARYALKVAKYINRSITFKAGIDAVAIQPGDVFSFSHDVPQWGYSGRIAEGHLGQVTLDRNVTIEEGKTYKLRVKLSDDTIEEKTVSNSVGTTNIITVASNFTSAPLQYSIYSFGESSKVKKDFRASEIERSFRNKVTITAAEYNSNVYDDSAITVPVSNYSALILTIPPVRNLALTERLVVLPDGTIENVIDVWWDKPTTSVTFVRTYLKSKIYISEDNINWRYVGESFGNHFGIISGILKGVTYYVSVVSVTDNNTQERLTAAPSAEITITSTPSAPADVTSFVYTFNDEIDFVWDKNSEGNIAGYEIRTVDNNWGVDNNDLQYRGMVTRWTEIRPATRSGTTYYIKAYSTSGIFSDNATSVSPVNAAPAAPIVTKIELFQKSFLSWDDVADKDLKHYEVWSSSTNAWAGEEQCETKVAGGVIAGTGLLCLVNVPDNPTYFKVRGIDSLGAGDFSTAVTVNTVQIVSDDIATNAITAVKILTDSITANKYHELRNTYVYNAIDSLDASYSLEVPFKIVSELLTVQSVKLSFKILEFRAYSKDVASGGGATSGATGSASGGGSTSGQTGGAHHHELVLANIDSGARAGVTGGILGINGGGVINVPTVEGHSHTITCPSPSIPGARYNQGAVVAQDQGGIAITNVVNGHYHTFQIQNVGTDGASGAQIWFSGGSLRCSGGGTIKLSVGKSDHTHTTPAHTHPNHTHTTPNHSHSLGFGIYEDSTSPTIHYHIDNGAGYGGASSDHTTDQTDLDITASITGAGWKSIRFDTNLRCRIAAIIEVKLDISA